MILVLFYALYDLINQAKKDDPTYEMSEVF